MWNGLIAQITAINAASLAATGHQAACLKQLNDSTQLHKQMQTTAVTKDSSALSHIALPTVASPNSDIQQPS